MSAFLLLISLKQLTLFFLRFTEHSTTYFFFIQTSLFLCSAKAQFLVVPFATYPLQGPLLAHRRVAKGCAESNHGGLPEAQLMVLPSLPFGAQIYDLQRCGTHTSSLRKLEREPKVFPCEDAFVSKAA